MASYCFMEETVVSLSTAALPSLNGIVKVLQNSDTLLQNSTKSYLFTPDPC